MHKIQLQEHYASKCERQTNTAFKNNTGEHLHDHQAGKRPLKQDTKVTNHKEKNKNTPDMHCDSQR